MSLYAIGDLHLHFQAELKAPGQLREPVWKDHDAENTVIRKEPPLLFSFPLSGRKMNGSLSLLYLCCI